MKAITVLCIVTLVATFPSQNGLSQSKKNRKEKQQEAIDKTKQLIDSGTYIFVPDRAYPQGGRSIDLTTNYGFIKIKRDKSIGDLPFFGRAYQIDYGSNEGGIKFEGEMLEKKFETNEKKKKYTYSFTVKDRDTYQIHMEIEFEGGAYVNVISNNRSFISYSGRISELEEEDK